MPLSSTIFPIRLPEIGPGDDVTTDTFDALIAEHSTPLGDSLAFAHMDPPTSAVAAAVVARNAQTNQNLLHPELSPLASVAEAKAIDWLAPFFGMQDGLMCSGSTLANLTALWCARENGATRVVASSDAHLSIAKAAHLLGMPFQSVPVNEAGQVLGIDLIAGEFDCVVLTAGTTARGAIDDLQPKFSVKSAWLHIDAAWAGPLRLTSYADRLHGIEYADSVAVSAHKWLYQPKDSALIFFKDPSARDSISFGGAYLAAPNVGVQGSRGAAGLALLSTLWSQGRAGLAAIIEKGISDAETFANFIDSHSALELKSQPQTGVVNWRPVCLESSDAAHNHVSEVAKTLGLTSSSVTIDGELWLRQVAANPYVDIGGVIDKVLRATQPI